MDTNEFRDKLISGRMTRREVNKALASAGVGLVTIPFVPRLARSATEDHPTFYAWEGYEGPEVQGAYIAKYGEAANVTLFGDEEEAEAKMVAGFKPDVAMPCSYKIQKWHDFDFLGPIDESRLGNWPDIIPTLKAIPAALIDGKRYWVCMDWGQTSITYRTDLVDIEEESWGLLWDERYKGRLALFDSLIDGVMVAAIYAGAKNPFDMTPEEVAKTKELMRQQRPVLRYYSNSLTDIENALAAGELVAATTWNDSFTRLTEQGLPVKFMNPKEGAMTWTCGLTLMAWAEKVDRCYDLMDALLSPETGAFEIMDHGFGHSNVKAFELVAKEELAKRGLPTNPDDLAAFLASGIFQDPIQNEPELQKMFEEIKAGF